MDFTDSDDTQAPEDSQFLETQLDFSCPPQFAPECNTFKWKVQIRDANGEGEIEEQTLTTKEVWKLQNRRVIVHFDEDCGQPDEDLEVYWGLGQLSNDVNFVPIDYADWRVFAPHRKDKAWDIILTNWFDNPDTKKNYVLSVLGSRCKDFKVRLWKMYKRSDRTETVLNRPAMVPEDQWNGFVSLDSLKKWKKMRERNINNQKKNTLPHVCGRKSFARKRRNITKQEEHHAEQNFSLQAVRSLMELVCEEAKSRADELTLLMSENLSVERSNITASLDDEYSKVFGPERSGRVRCLGRGPTPSKLLKMSNTPNLAAHKFRIAKSSPEFSRGMIQQLVGATTIQRWCQISWCSVKLANQPNFADIYQIWQPKTEIIWIRVRRINF
ncbi:LOW QUALITY PROTEIN: hypothetical protein HID58_096294 [Brassica napus]|uniref:Uncharacterized protein n=1 Tax=Brassica napus TaxID=3708 RepID=A0ABQ7X0U5_BRANA|nr:LOW QUALITY PROTEIN: hypothetical protein HID58_096294 [Brassica napus]